MHSKSIFLIKHGETEENNRGIHQGQAVGGELSKQGSNDILKVGESLASAGIAVDRMLVSPMTRCRDSAALLISALEPANVRVDQRLTAKNSGHLGGRPRDFAVTEAARRGVPIHQLRTPGGESSEDVQLRYESLWDEVCAGSDGTTVLVGHGGGIACLLLRLTASGFDDYLQHVPGSACVTWAEVTRSSTHLRLVNVLPTELAGRLPARTAG